MGSKYSVAELSDIAEEMMSEYEAGSADVETCDGVTLNQWKSCVEDFILYVEHSEQDEQESFGGIV